MARGSNKPGAAAKKGAGATTKAASSARDDGKAANDGTSVALMLQQKCLDVFRDSLNPSVEDSGVLQEVKGHLYNRDFAAAFGREEYLRVYASRWSPSRALAYLQVFSDLAVYLTPRGDGAAALEQGTSVRAVCCLGGGAGGELIGLGAWSKTVLEAETGSGIPSLNVDLVDIADWSAVSSHLHSGLTSAPELSKYASQAKKDANRALVPPSSLSSNFHQLDVLSSDADKQAQLAALLQDADLVTFMFTLNELYSTSLPATQALLNRIADIVKAGSHLLVVDSPGSYSTVSLNGTEKKYPMQWLLDHILLGSKTSGGDENAKWEKVVEDESRWFRLSKQLKYPIALEDMRFQMHFFRRR